MSHDKIEQSRGHSKCTQQIHLEHKVELRMPSTSTKLKSETLKRNGETVNNMRAFKIKRVLGSLYRVGKPYP